MKGIVYPSLWYRDAHGAIDFLTRAFGFKAKAVYEGDRGEVAHAELAFGASVVMLGTAQPKKGWRSPLDLAGVNQGLYVYVPRKDLDAHHERARSAGAQIAYAPRDTEYGSREYGCVDPEGHFWSFGTYKPKA